MSRFTHKRVSFDVDDYKDVDEFKLAVVKHIHYKDIPLAISKFKKLKDVTNSTKKKAAKDLRQKSDVRSNSGVVEQESGDGTVLPKTTTI